MLRVLLVLLTVAFLASGPYVEKKRSPNQEVQPLPDISTCEEGYPPKGCPPYCDC